MSQPFKTRLWGQTPYESWSVNLGAKPTRQRVKHHVPEVCCAEMWSPVAAVRKSRGSVCRTTLRPLRWVMRKNQQGWNQDQSNAMHWLQRSNLKSVRAWRLKQALRQVYSDATGSNCETFAREALGKWISWARRCRLEPFKRVAKTLKTHLEGVVRGMLDGRSNACVEAMNGLLQQTKRAARGFRNVGNFIAIAYLRKSRLQHLSGNPLILAIPKDYGRDRHVCA